LGYVDRFILGADLNARPNSSCYRFLISGASNAGMVYTGNNAEEVKKAVGPYKNSIAFTSAYEPYNSKLAGQEWKPELSIEERIKQHIRYYIE